MQVYIVLDDDSDRALLIPKIERCVDDNKCCSIANDLKINGDKTEVLHITSRFRKSSSLPCVQICNSSIEPVENAGNLGVIVQNDLKMDLFVNNICRSASFALYRIGQIRKFLETKCTEMLVHAFITCLLDPCNSLLYALPESQIAKLHRIQNSAARLVSLSRKYDQITQILHELHWLPVKYQWFLGRHSAVTLLMSSANFNKIWLFPAWFTSQFLYHIVAVGIRIMMMYFVY